MAIQGASPSGRLTAVLGRSGSVARAGGCCRGEALLELEGTRGLCVLDVLRAPAGVTLRVALGGLAVGIAETLLTDFAIVGGDAPVDFETERTALAEIGVPVADSVSSSKFWLAALLPLALGLGLADVSSSAMLPLKVRFLGRGVSRSNLPDGIGKGLDVKTGILDPLFRTTG